MGKKADIQTLDILATQRSDNGAVSIAIVNKDPGMEQRLQISLDGMKKGSCTVRVYRIAGKTTASYNDIDRNEVFIETLPQKQAGDDYEAVLPPHSVNVIVFSEER